MINIAEQVQRGKEILSVIRLKPFDTSEADTRAKERYRRIGLSAIGSGFARAVSVLTSLISVPLALGYLGAERYGLWVVISSTIVMLSFADLGIGNGLINAVSEANGRDDKELAKQYISSALFILIGIALLIGVAFVVAFPHIPWNWVFNVSDPETGREVGATVRVFAVCFLVNIPLGVVQRIQMGYQEGFLNSLWQAAGNLLGLASVLLVIYLKGSLPWMVFALAGVPLVATLINGAILFGAQRPWLKPAARCVSLDAVRRILNTGFLFFALQIAMALAYQSDNLVISHFMGARYVPLYSIPMKLFMLAPMISSFMLMPLWPAYGEALTRHDLAWIKKTFVRSVGLAIAINTAAALALALLFRPITRVWLGSPLIVPSAFLFGLAAWTVLNGLAGPIAMLLNGTNTIRLQVQWALIMGVANILLSIFLVQRIGIAGPVYGTVITWTLLNLIPYATFVPRMFASWRPDLAAK